MLRRRRRGVFDAHTPGLAIRVMPRAHFRNESPFDSTDTTQVDRGHVIVVVAG
jgi:hypothetical protein